MIKTRIITLILLCLTITAFGEKVTTINNPAFEFTNSGIYEVAKIELSKEETRLYIHSIFIPKWWVKYSEKDCIYLHETGDTLYPTKIIGAVFGKKLWMPASGDSTIVMVYPPIDKKVKTIDWFTLDDDQNIYGISLDPKQKRTEEKRSIPTDIKEWMDKELSAFKDRQPMDLNSDNIFQDGKARIIGYIKGYDIRAGFTTGIIYNENVFTREDFPTVIKVHPDGRFETTIQLSHPIHNALNFDRHWIDFYAEPNQITCLIIDYKDFLMADRLRNIRYQFQNLEYLGPLAVRNKELNQFKEIEYNYRQAEKRMKSVEPDKIIAFEKDWKQKNINKLNLYKKENNLSDASHRLILNSILVEYGERMFSYPSRKSYYAKNDAKNEILKMPLPENYYDFVDELPLNEPGLLIARGYKSFINRFEYMDMLREARPARFSINSNEFYKLYTDNGIKLNNEESKLFKLMSKKELTEDERSMLKENHDKIVAVNKKHKNILDKYIEIKNANAISSSWETADSIIDANIQQNAQFSKDIIKVRSLNGYCTIMSSEAAHAMWSTMRGMIKHQAALEQGDNLMTGLFALKESKGYELPECEGTKIFKNIIDPFKGKVLFVDFWATTCGPCIAGIERMKETRKKYANNPNFDFIFITDDRSSREPRYSQFVKDQELKNTYKISSDEYLHLRELFKFNGIPRYVLIGADGKVLDDNFAMHNFKYELKKLFPEIGATAEK